MCCFQLRLSQKWSKSKKHHSLFTFEFWLCLLLKSDKSDIFLPDLQLTCLSFYPSLGNHTRPTYNWSRSISHKNYTSGAINLSHIYKCAPISHQHDALLMWSLSQLSTDSSTAVHERWWNDMQKHYLHLLTLFFFFCQTATTPTWAVPLWATESWETVTCFVPRIWYDLYKFKWWSSMHW